MLILSTLLTYCDRSLTGQEQKNHCKNMTDTFNLFWPRAVALTDKWAFTIASEIYLTAIWKIIKLHLSLLKYKPNSQNPKTSSSSRDWPRQKLLSHIRLPRYI